MNDSNCPVFNASKLNAVNFKLYPEKSYGPLKDSNRLERDKYYYQVYIFYSKQSMKKFRKLLQSKDNANKLQSSETEFEAQVSTYKSKFIENRYQFGVILFYKKSAKKAGTVSHEMLHAATFWWKSVFSKREWNKILDDMSNNELLCYLLGDMVTWYWIFWYKAVDKKLLNI